MTVTSLGLVLLFFPIRFLLLLRRLFDPDELEHVHAGFSIATGLMPYRDFFEHHGPLTYWVSALLFRVFEPTALIILLHRGISLIAVLITISLVVGTGRKWLGRGHGWLAAAWLACGPVFVEKSVEWRPDVLAMLLLVLALTRSIRHGARSGSVLLAGLLCGLATLATQKAIFASVGLAVGLACNATSIGQGIRRVVLFGAGGALVWLITTGIFYLQHAHVSFLSAMLVYPIIWPKGVPDLYQSWSLQLFGPNWWSPAHLGTGLLGLAELLRQARRRRPRGRIARLILGMLVGQLLGLCLTPAVYLQYHLLQLPVWALTASAGFHCQRRLARQPIPHRQWITPIVVSIIAAVVGLPWHLPYFQRNFYGWIDVIALSLLLLGIVVWWLQRRIGQSLMIAALIFPSAGRAAVPLIAWPTNTQQRLAIDALRQLLPPGETLQDGFSGLGCLVPHAGYWWWLNDHSVLLARKLGDWPAVQAQFEQNRPGIILGDQYTLKTPIIEMIEPVIRQHYKYERERIPQMVGLWVRNDLAAKLP